MAMALASGSAAEDRACKRRRPRQKAGQAAETMRGRHKKLLTGLDVAHVGQPTVGRQRRSTTTANSAVAALGLEPKPSTI